MKNKPFLSLCLLLLTLVLSMALPGNALAQGPTPPDIEGDQLVIGNTFTLLAEQRLNGDLAILGGNATLERDSVVNGNIAVIGGNVEVSGRVNGDISSIGGQVYLTESAIVTGDVIVPAGMLRRDPGARVDGEIITQQDAPWRDTPINPQMPYRPFPWFQHGMDIVGNILGGLFSAIALAALALVLALLFVRPLQNVAEAIATEPVLSGGAGLLAVLLTPLILALLAITIILSPVALIGLLVLGIALILGWVGLGLELGNRIASLFKSRWTEPLAAAIGTLVLTLLAYALNYLPCCGWVINLLLSAIGLGAVILSRFGSTSYPVSLRTPARPSPAAAPVIVTNEQPAPGEENHAS